MKRVAVRKPERAFQYVMEHYYCWGQRDCCLNPEKYAVISVQDSGGAGFCFTENEFCTGVLTLRFDNITDEEPGKILFDDAAAEEIIAFVLAQQARGEAETLLIHCDDSCMRARAVAAFVTELSGGSADAFFARGLNEYVFDVLDNAWFMHRLGREAAHGDSGSVG